jgi:hypothetical protein
MAKSNNTNALVGREVQALILPEKPKVLEAKILDIGEDAITVQYERRGLKLQQIPFDQVVSITIKEPDGITFAGKEAIVEYNPPFDTLNGTMKLQSKQGTVFLKKRGEKESLVMVPRARVLSIKDVGGGDSND